MIERPRARWGFEIQAFDIIPVGKAPPGAYPNHATIPPLWMPRWSPNGELWVPSGRTIVGPNVVIDLAQEELIKIWRSIQTSVRRIQDMAVGSGLTDPTDSDVALETELDSKNIDVWDDALITPDSTGLSLVRAQVTWLSLEAIGRLSEIGLKFDNGDLVTHALFKKLAISGATQTNPVRITTSTTHELSTGDEVHIDNVGGMVELNDRDFNITVFDADEFDLDGEDGTGHTAFTSGGDVWLVKTKTTGQVLQTNYVLTFTS